MIKERPILFSAPMVNAILGWHKTQTRRVVKPQPDCEAFGGKPYWYIGGLRLDQQATNRLKCPYGEIGDRLWVRETYWADKRTREIISYVASEPDIYDDNHTVKKMPSIFMRRKYSRINLLITDIRIERLQDITDDGALAEGVDRTNTSIKGYARARFEKLWKSINGADSWDKNPYVWVIEFERVDK